MTAKPDMLIKWYGEDFPESILRRDAAYAIRKNRNNPLVKVFRKFGDTYLVSDIFEAGCVIYKKEGQND